MDFLLDKVVSQGLNFAIRSGITITTTYAFKQCGRLLKEAPRGREREELMQLQLRLESKIRILSPAIDMIELISSRGNTSLESAVSLTKEIRYEIQKLGTRLSNAANDEQLVRRKSSKAKSREETEREMRAINDAIKNLLIRVEDAVPLINLAITTSGVNLSTKLSGTISPSRLLQASTFLTAADSRYSIQPDSRQQVGPTYTISLYMLFTGHAWRPVDEEGIRETTWKEVIHKSRVKLMRVPLNRLYDLPGQATGAYDAGHDSMPADAGSAEYAYQLVIVEDLDDGRVHTFEDGDPQPGPFDDVVNAGIRDVVPVHEVSKIFYADTGKILNIGGDGETNNPVLLLKRDVHAEPPRRMLHRSQMADWSYFDEPTTNGAENTNGKRDQQAEVDAQFERESAPNTPLKEARPSTTEADRAWRLPSDLDPEWVAFEVFAEEPESESDDEEVPQSDRRSASRQGSLDPDLSGALSKLKLRSSTTSSSPMANNQLTHHHLAQSPTSRHTPSIKTSLSLLEMLLKLAALQQFRQDSHLAIEDELLNFFLEDSATAGAGPDKDYRQRLRHDAVRRVGFDPYDESPIKRRNEEYIAHARAAASPRPDFDPNSFQQHLPYDESYGYDDNSIPHPSGRPHYSPSSPSPRPLFLQQTPSRSSTPGSLNDSRRHRSAVQAKYASSSGRPGSSSQTSQTSLATPPSTTRTRQAFLRAQSEPKPGSPLAKEYIELGQDGDERGGGGSEGLD